MWNRGALTLLLSQEALNSKPLQNMAFCEISLFYKEAYLRAERQEWIMLDYILQAKSVKKQNPEILTHVCRVCTLVHLFNSTQRVLHYIFFIYSLVTYILIYI